MIRALVAFSICALLAACSGGTESQNNALRLVGDLRDTVRANREARRNPPAPPQLSRALIDQLTIGAIEVTLESRDLTAYLSPVALRSDEGPGDVTVWATVDDSNVILRDGVLYATRGLGRDLAASEISSTVSALRAKRAGGGAREMQIRDDTFGLETLRFSCAIDVVEDTRITIVERSFAVRHLQETCVNENGQFINDYWVDGVSDVIQSRQWAGPRLGYLQVRVLKK